MEYDELLARIAKTLEENQKPYFVTGGFAVSVWGRLRATFDIDIVMVVQEQDIPLLVRILRKLGEAVYVEEQMMREAVKNKGEFNVIHPDSGLKIDFWVWDSEDQFERSCLKRRVMKEVRNQKVYFISPEDLILSKLQWYRKSGSDRHLEDVESVFKISGDKLDKEYIKQWAKHLGILELLNKVNVQ